MGLAKTVQQKMYIAVLGNDKTEELDAYLTEIYELVPTEILEKIRNLDYQELQPRLKAI